MNTTTTRKNRLSNIPTGRATAPTVSEPTRERMRKAASAADSSKPSPARRLKLERLFTEFEKLKNAAKEVYAEIDRIEAELLASVPVGDAVPLSDGRMGTIQDNFLDRHGQPRNVSYKPCGVRRFEVTIK